MRELHRNVSKKVSKFRIELGLITAELLDKHKPITKKEYACSLRWLADVIHEEC